jgi:chemotaxis protein CheC
VRLSAAEIGVSNHPDSKTLQLTAGWGDPRTSTARRRGTPLMNLTEERKDALTELVNIGYARAAGALSDMTEHRITLGVPDVTIYQMDRIRPALEEALTGEVTSVHQVFDGPICGNAILLFDRAASLALSGLLTGTQPKEKLDETGCDAITEVGNVLLNACVGAFSNLMKMNIKFTIPQVQIEQVERIFQSVRVADEGVKCAMMVRTRFDIRRSDVTGFLVILLAITYSERLMESLEEWSSQ